MDITPEKLKLVDAWYWAQFSNIILQGGIPFDTRDHQYQIAILQCTHPYQVDRKAAQMGVTEINVLRLIHAMINKIYPRGAMYLFPTSDDVGDFSKARFKTLIEDNPAIAQHVRSTDSTHIKQIRDAILYLRGARAGKTIEGNKKSSTKLKSAPVDCLIFDEYDEMEPSMIALAMARLDHSDVKHVRMLSTPTIPDYGIDKAFKNSNQQFWHMKCDSCGKYTCPDEIFPNGIAFDENGSYLECQNCKSKLNPNSGEWVAKHPNITDCCGRHISQLMSTKVQPGLIYNAFNEPERYNLDISEVYNSKLGLPYIAAENRLTKQDIYECCTSEPIKIGSKGPCAMGVDVGNTLHVVVGGNLGEKKREILGMFRCKNWDEVHDIGQRFNVQTAVIDAMPELHRAREFQKAQNYEVFLCYYNETQNTTEVFNLDKEVVTANRNEVLDESHTLVTNHLLKIPRQCPEIEEFATEMCNIAKILVTDKDTGMSKYKYIKLETNDHYRHATTYFNIACKRTNILQQGGNGYRSQMSDTVDSGGYGW